MRARLPAFVCILNQSCDAFVFAVSVYFVKAMKLDFSSRLTLRGSNGFSLIEKHIAEVSFRDIKT